MASDFITDKKTVLLSPIITLLFTTLFLIIWLISFIYVFSVGSLRYDKGDIFGDIEWSNDHYYFIYLMIFGFLWKFSFYLSAN